MTLTEIEAQLKAPFSFDDIDFLPKGKVEREGKTLCMALPYADPRVYQDRLNSVAYGEWSTPAPVVVAAGNKLICYVTVVVCGVAHTDVGEATNNEENTGTEAWAQAFKRACSQFGLGRYLYDLEKEWVPFNPQRKQIELNANEKRAIVRKMYQKAGITLPGTVTKPATVEASNGHQITQADAPATDQQLASIRKLREHLGKPEFENAEQIGYLEAKQMIEELSKDYREARKAGEQQGVSPAIVRMVEIARGRAKKLDADWELLKTSVFDGPVSDSKLSMHHFAKINGELTKREKAAAN